MSLQPSYRLIAPFYDILLERATLMARCRSLSFLPNSEQASVLLCGAGTGLDFPHLPLQPAYTALDLTGAMLQAARRKFVQPRVAYIQGDSMALPFPDASFDHVVLHLILAVVPEPVRCLQEANRVLKVGGSILVFDKFLRHGQNAWVRRAFTPLSSKIATRLDVVFEDILVEVPNLQVTRDEAALARGWFRLIGLQKVSA